MADNEINRKAAEILGSISRHKKEAKTQAVNAQREFVSNTAKATVDAIKPMLNEIASATRVTKADMEAMVSKIKVETHTPDVIMPDIEVPKAEVTVRSPKIRIPDVIMPDEMNVKGFVSLMGIDAGNPLPVQLRTAKGEALDLSGLTSQSGGSGGSRVVKINNTDSEPIPITGSLSATLSADTGSGEIGDETLRMVMATDAIASVNIVSGSSSGTEYADGATASPSTGVLSMGDTGEESGNIFALATHSGVTGSGVLRVVQASDSVASTVVNSGTLTTVSTVTAVTGITNSIAAVITDSSGVQYSGSNPVPVDGSGVTQPVSGTITETNSAAILADTASIDTSTGNSETSLAIMDDWDATHDSAIGSDGAVVMAEAHTANPTAVADGDAVRLRATDTGNLVMRPLQVRDLLQTAYVTAASEGPKTLLAGSSGVFHDMVYFMAANESDAAITLDITQTTSGTVQGTVVVPATSTAGLALGGASIPQDHADATWQVDNISSDASNTTYSVTALFSKEV